MPKLRLKLTHTHAGVAYPAGHLIEVDEHTARWLTERAIGIPVLGTVVSNEAAPAVPSPAPRLPRIPATPKE
jgi:hypothetical protein